MSGQDDNDVINAANGIRETVNCGAGADRATVDRTARVTGCERVTRSTRHPRFRRRS
jgi:hypothetical protein